MAKEGGLAETSRISPRTRPLLAKRTAHKEIEAWACGAGMLTAGSDKSGETVVVRGGQGMGNQLTDNITEEKLLRRHLLKLSKERFKHMAEKDYQKNRFIDRQLTKARKMTRLLMDVDLEQYRKKDASERDVLRERMLYNRKLIIAQRFNIGLNELENQLRADQELSATKSLPSRQNSEYPQLAAHRPGTVPEVTLRKIPPQQLPQINSQASCLGAQETEKVDQPATVVTDNEHTDKESIIRPSTTCVLERQLLRLPNTPSRQSSARRKVQQDPRCSNLCHTLVPKYKPPTAQKDVPTLVSHINTLHLPSKRTVQLKIKPSPEVLLYMFEQRCQTLRSQPYPMQQCSDSQRTWPLTSR